MYCMVLYCIELYCIVLYYIDLYCVVLYCIVLYCMYCIVKNGDMKQETQEEKTLHTQRCIVEKTGKQISKTHRKGQNRAKKPRGMIVQE